MPDPGTEGLVRNSDDVKATLETVLTATDTDGIRQCLRRWKQSLHASTEAPLYLVYLLNKEYTDEAIGRTIDYARDDLARVTAFADDPDFRCFPCNLEEFRHGICVGDYEYGGRYWGDEEQFESEDGSQSSEESEHFHYVEEVQEEWLPLRIVVDGNGNTVLRDIEVDANSVTLPEAFELHTENPDKEDYHEADYGATASHTYRESALLIVPRQYWTDFRLGSLPTGDLAKDDNLHFRIRMELRHMQSNVPEARSNLLRLCTQVVKEETRKRMRSRYAEFKARVYTIVCDACISMNEVGLLADMIRVGKDSPEKIVEVLARGVAVLGVANMQAILDVVMRKPPPKVSQDDMIRAFEAALTGECSVVKDRFKDRRRSYTTRGLQSMIENGNVGEALNVVCSSSDSKRNLEKLMPSLKLRLGTAAKAVDFGTLLLSAVHEGKLTKELAGDAIQDLGPHDLAMFELPKAQIDKCQAANKDKWLANMPEYKAAAKKIDELKSLFMGLLSVCTGLGLDAAVCELLLKVHGQVGGVPNGGFRLLLLPFLVDAVAVMRKAKIPLSTPAYRNFATSILGQYNTRGVCKEPAPPTSKLNKCGCVLDKFLLDPGSKNKEFPMKKSRRDHLEIQLRSQRSSLCIETKARGSPYILVLSKTNGEYELHAWQKRTKAVKTIMDKLGNVDDLGDSLTEKLLQVTDPHERARLWLQMCCQPDAESQIPQQTIWEEYYGTFKAFPATHRVLSWEEFWVILQSTFSGACVKGSKSQSRFVVTGVRAKDTALLGSGKKASKQDSVVPGSHSNQRREHGEQSTSPAIAASTLERFHLPREQNGCLNGMSFVFTGQLPHLGREEGTNVVRYYGGKVLAAPTKNTSFVVLGDDAGPEKLKCVKHENLATLNGEGLFELIRRFPPCMLDNGTSVASTQGRAAVTTSIPEDPEPTTTGRSTPASVPTTALVGTTFDGPTLCDVQGSGGFSAEPKMQGQRPRTPLRAVVNSPAVSAVQPSTGMKRVAESAIDERAFKKLTAVGDLSDSP